MITSAVRFHGVLDGVQSRGIYLEDAGFPEHVTWMLQLLDNPRLPETG